MRVWAAQDSGMQQRIPELNIIPKYRRASHLFPGIQPGFALTNWFIFLLTDYHYFSPLTYGQLAGLHR